MPDQESAEEVSGTSRRGMLRGAAGIGAAGIAAGVFAGAVAAPAMASTKEPKADEAKATRKEPLIVHVHEDVLDIYAGEDHVRVTDHELAARLARAAG